MPDMSPVSCSGSDNTLFAVMGLDPSTDEPLGLGCVACLHHALHSMYIMSVSKHKCRWLFCSYAAVYTDAFV